VADILWSDTETFSPTDIRKGTDRYSRDAEIMLFQYALNDGPVHVWDRTADPIMPADLEEYLADQDLLVFFHNARFDKSVCDTNGFYIAPHRLRCSMAMALAHSLPGGLDKLCHIFNIAEDKAKLKDGKALVKLFCCPQPFKHTLKREDFATPKEYREALAAARAAWTGRATRHTHPEEWARFIQYGANDIEAMRAVVKKMPKCNYGGAGEVAKRETALWHLDQKMNTRGVQIDVDLVNKAIATASRTKVALAEEAQELTGYDAETGKGVKATTQRTVLLNLLNDRYDLDLPDLRGATVERLLKSDVDLPDVVVTLLRNRLAASSTSVSKYEAFAKLTGPDGRLRNTTQFCGAMRTGRDAGRGVQLQNLPRPTMKHKAIIEGIENIKADCADLIYDNPMELLSSAVRGSIIAPPGGKLVVADLSNIEGRKLAWLSGEEWKLKAFRDYDTCLGVDGRWYTGDQIRDSVLAGRPIELKLDKKGEPTRRGHDLYALAYAKAFRITPEEVMENKKSGDGSMRQIGKVMELALGYEGGVGAFVTFAIAYGIDLDDMAVVAYPAIPPEVVGQARKAYKWAVEKGRDYEMDELTYIVCDSFKRLWRMAHPETSAWWKELENAFRYAMLEPGKVFTARRVSAVKEKSWLRLILPSGRSLCYPNPKLEGPDEKLSYMGVNHFTRQWLRIKTYSGKLAENVTQASSRDVFKFNAPMIEDAGYELLIPVHDEQITETPDLPAYSADHLAALMSLNPAWAEGLPLAAAGFEDVRYRKD